jgi:hypothetical protein
VTVSGSVQRFTPLTPLPGFFEMTLKGTIMTRKSKKSESTVSMINGDNENLYGTEMTVREDEMTGHGFVFKNFNRQRGISQSWANPEVRLSRLTHNAVEVDGVKYESVRKAFTALGLPDCKHIKFRGKLKASGQETFEGHEFVLIK